MTDHETKHQWVKIISDWAFLFSYQNFHVHEIFHQFSLKNSSKHNLCPWYLINFYMSNFKFQISNICFDFFNCACLKTNDKYSKFDTFKWMSYQGHKWMKIQKRLSTHCEADFTWSRPYDPTELAWQNIWP